MMLYIYIYIYTVLHTCDKYITSRVGLRPASLYLSVDPAHDGTSVPKQITAVAAPLAPEVRGYIARKAAGRSRCLGACAGAQREK